MNGIAWWRVAQGLQLAGFGVFLLLTTQGLLPWFFWAEAASFWPVLLVGAGLRLVFERSRAPWAVLLSPVIVLGTLAWVARESGAPPAGDWVSRSIARPEGVERWTLAMRLAGARVDLETATLAEDLLAEGRSKSRKGRGRLEVRRPGPESVVRLDSGRGDSVSFGPPRRQLWELRLNQSLPIGLDVEGALLGGRLDLTGGRVTAAEVEGAFNDFELRLPRPTSDVSLRVKGVFNGLRLVVPAATPVRVRTEGPFNHVERDKAQTPADGPGYDLRVEGLMNHVVVEEG